MPLKSNLDSATLRSGAILSNAESVAESVETIRYDEITDTNPNAQMRSSYHSIHDYCASFGRLATLDAKYIETIGLGFEALDQKISNEYKG